MKNLLLAVLVLWAAAATFLGGLPRAIVAPGCPPTTAMNLRTRGDVTNRASALAAQIQKALSQHLGSLGSGTCLTPRPSSWPRW